MKDMLDAMKYGWEAIGKQYATTASTIENTYRKMANEWVQRNPRKEYFKMFNIDKVKKVIFNPPATIVYWFDGTKTVVKAQDGEIFDKEKGFAMACTKKFFGNKGNYYNEFKKHGADQRIFSISIDLAHPTKTVGCYDVEFPDYGWTSSKEEIETELGITHKDEGLPKEGSTISDWRTVVKLVDKNLNKEIYPSTKPSIDFIYKILEEAYNSGIQYDIRCMTNRIVAFAANSTNHAEYCLGVVDKMKFKSKGCD